MLQIATHFDRSKLDQTQDYTGNLMVSISAPEDPDSPRTPICVALVLDVSGSMSGYCPDGRTKIEALKDTAARLIQNLTDKDEVAILPYSDSVMPVQHRIKVTNKEGLLLAIEKLRTIANTNISGALLAGFEEVNCEFQGVQRVLLLTDGLPTVGVTDGNRLLEMVRNRSNRNITLSTFGFGNDADQELLASMAKEGGGNYYYISGGKDVREAFARELGGVTSCEAQNIQVKVKPNQGNGNEILEILNDYNVTKEGDNDSVAVINAEDIYQGETKHILVRMKIQKPNGKPKDRPFSIAHVEVSYNETKAKTGERQKVEFNPKVEFVKPDEADKDADLKVAEQVGILETAAAQLRAVKLANQGDFAAAKGILRSARMNLAGLAAQGSDIALQAEGLMELAEVDFDESVYTPTHANQHVNAARGTMRHRATASGNANVAALYQTEKQKKMKVAFDDSKGKVDPVAPVVPVNPVVPVVPAPPAPPAKKDFTKSKKRQR